MVNPISVIISVVANLFVIFVEYHKNKKITRIHLLIFCVPISDIIFSLTTHTMITLTAFGIWPETLYGKNGKLFILIHTFRC